MNIIQKHKSKTAKVYISEEDNSVGISNSARTLIDFFSVTPRDYSIQLHFGELEDLSLQFVGILLSAIKTANEGRMPITLYVHPKLGDLIFPLGTGNLQYSIELVEDSK